MKQWIWIIFHPRETARVLAEREAMVRKLAGDVTALLHRRPELAETIREVYARQGVHIGDLMIGEKGGTHVERTPKVE